MADEITIRYRVSQAEQPERARAAWKANPPAWLAAAGYELVDESFNGLVYRADVSSTAQRMLTFGWGKTLYTLSLIFSSDGSVGSLVTITGQAPAKTAAAIREEAAAAGGGDDPRH